jgi:hypothetical protein
MSTETVAPCACCKDPTPTSDLKLVDCLVGYVCRECRRNLHIAAHALFEAKIPAIYRGPFCGNSIG